MGVKKTGSSRSRRIGSCAEMRQALRKGGNALKETLSIASQQFSRCIGKEREREKKGKKEGAGVRARSTKSSSS